MCDGYCDILAVVVVVVNMAVAMHLQVHWMEWTSE